MSSSSPFGALPATASALAKFVSSHRCAACGGDPVEADALPSDDKSLLPHMFACCDKRVCGKCVAAR